MYASGRHEQYLCLPAVLLYYYCSRGVEAALPMLEAGASLSSLVSPCLKSAVVFGQSDPPVARTASRSSSFENHRSRRVLPRWLFVKVTDEEGRAGWGEATLEGHTQAVEGCLDALRQRLLGYEAQYGWPHTRSGAQA